MVMGCWYVEAWICLCCLTLWCCLAVPDVFTVVGVVSEKGAELVGQ